MKKREILERFGKTLVKYVRDSSYHQFKRIMEGELKSKSAQLLYEEIKKFNGDEFYSLEIIVRDTIDSTLHHFLWMIEQNEEYDLVCYEGENEQPISLREISDGLCGELYTEDGWIERFSKYPPSIK